MAKAKAKAAVKRKPAKAPTRAAAAPKSAAPKPAKSSGAKAGAAKTTKSAATKSAAKTVAAVKTTTKATTKPDVAPVQRTTGQLTLPAAKKVGTLPAAKQVEASPAKPQSLTRKTADATAPRADLPPADGFTLLVDGHFKSSFDDLKGAKAAASELKGRFPMLRVEIYDAAKKTRLPA